MLESPTLPGPRPDASATRELAWTLLFDASGSRMLADDWCDSFAEEILERLPQGGPVLAREEIAAWLDSSPGLAPCL